MLATINADDWRAIEAQLRESEERFRIMANCAPVMLWMSGLDGLCNFFNEGWLRFSGRSMEQELGNGWAEGVHAEDFQRCMHVYLDAFVARHDFSMEYRLRRHDGEYRWILDQGAPRFSPDGNFQGFIGSCIDITDRVDAAQALTTHAEELRRSNSELELFAYAASHDLKSPLRGISQLARWIDEDLKNSLTPEVSDHLRLMHGRIARMERMLDDLLAYCRVGQTVSQRVTVDSGGLASEIFAMLEAPPGFQLVLEGELPVFVTFQAPFEQVLRNLIANAIKHHHRTSGTVTVSARQSGQLYIFAVADDGPGIAPEYQERIFTMFQTLHSRDQVEGSGIGLALVRKTLQAHGGTVTVESDGAHGTVFRFTWPAKMT
ncbi:MAG: PAS domain S-box protein [Burkholderiaceae bacterium]|nr:MAG: PAS domain S-box protein [Burkholderiaceae bacterium]